MTLVFSGLLFLQIVRDNNQMARQAQWSSLKVFSTSCDLHFKETTNLRALETECASPKS